jgi:hypothetical protein
MIISRVIRSLMIPNTWFYTRTLRSTLSLVLRLLIARIPGPTRCSLPPQLQRRTSMVYLTVAARATVHRWIGRSTQLPCDLGRRMMDRWSRRFIRRRTSRMHGREEIASVKGNRSDGANHVLRTVTACARLSPR